MKNTWGQEIQKAKAFALLSQYIVLLVDRWESVILLGASVEGLDHSEFSSPAVCRVAAVGVTSSPACKRRCQ
jgi:hypothetical protein